MQARSQLNTPLSDRVLWFDGDSAYDPSRLLHAIKSKDVKYVTKPSQFVDEYNRHASTQHQILVKQECEPLTYDWNIPEHVKKLDVVDYLFKAHDILMQDVDDDEFEQRQIRLATELKIYQKYKLYDVLRTIIWIINTLTVNNTVWGVGRGSSVSSYVLYVIGVHDVDSFAYQLDIDDFLHE